MKLPPFRRDPRPDSIASLYGMIVAQARLPCFYRDYAVPDTVNGRFELIVLHLALFLRRLKGESEKIRALGQGIFDRFCGDMDDNLREIGIGDLAIPKEMRRIGDAFYGRAQAYEAALASMDERALIAAVARNIFDNASTPPAGAGALAAYVQAAVNHLTLQADEAFIRGELSFPDPAGIAAPAAIS